MLREEQEEINQWINDGQRFIEQNDYRNAIDVLSLVIERDPDNFVSWFKLGVAYFESQDYVNALLSHIKAWCISPGYIEFDVIKSYEKLVEMQSKNFIAWVNAGDFWYQKGVYEKALECYDRSLDSTMSKDTHVALSSIWTKKGVIFYEMKEIEFALNNFEKALEIDSKDELAKSYKTKILRKIEKKQICAQCGAPLRFRAGQILGDQKYVVMNIADLQTLLGEKTDKFFLDRFEKKYKKIWSVKR